MEKHHFVDSHSDLYKREYILTTGTAIRILVHNDVMWALKCISSPALRLIVQKRIHADNKETTKALRYLPLVCGNVERMSIPLCNHGYRPTADVMPSEGNKNH